MESKFDGKIAKVQISCVQILVNNSQVRTLTNGLGRSEKPFMFQGIPVVLKQNTTATMIQ